MCSRLRACSGKCFRETPSTALSDRLNQSMALEFPLDGVQSSPLMALLEFSLSLSVHLLDNTVAIVADWDLQRPYFVSYNIHHSMDYRIGKRKLTSHTKPLESSCPLLLGNCGHGYQATSSPPTCGVCTLVADTSLCHPLGVAVVMLHSDSAPLSDGHPVHCALCRQKE